MQCSFLHLRYCSRKGTIPAMLLCRYCGHLSWYTCKWERQVRDTNNLVTTVSQPYYLSYLKTILFPYYLSYFGMKTSVQNSVSIQTICDIRHSIHHFLGGGVKTQLFCRVFNSGLEWCYDHKFSAYLSQVDLPYFGILSAEIFYISLFIKLLSTTSPIRAHAVSHR